MLKFADGKVHAMLCGNKATGVKLICVNPTESDVPVAGDDGQSDLFTDYEALEKRKAAEQAALDKEKRLQQAVLNIKKRMGANAILKGMNLEEGATGKARNEQIGGHRK